MNSILCLLLISFAQFVTMISGGVDDKAPFEFKILTAGADDSFTLPLYNGGTYNFTVDWGDGSNSTVTSWDDTDKTHTYEDEGATTYEISISGILKGWSFNNGDDKTLMKEITQWGIFNPGNSGGSFYGCTNMTITATDIIDLSGVTSLSQFFQGCENITTIPNMNDWDISEITSLYNMFNSCFVFNQDISDWDVSNVTTMQGTFAAAYGFEQNLGAWNVTSVTTMQGMFSGITLNTTNYDSILIGWAAQDVQNDVNFHGGNSKYSAGSAKDARDHLTDIHNWYITDGGQA